MSASRIVLYLHVHQPHRIAPYSVFDMGQRHSYFDDTDIVSNEEVFRKVAKKSYLPTNQMLLKLLNDRPNFALNLSLTGTFLEQCERWGSDVLQSFQALVATGRVEIVAETYHHSLAFFYSRFEFEKQVMMHREKIQQLFGVSPSVFRNTELAYNDELGQWAESAGYRAVLAEGWDPVLGGRSPNAVYRAVGTGSTRVLLKNYRLSDDIAFRFSNRDWSQWPLTADTYLSWLNTGSDNDVINLFMDFETFGEHQWKDSGIFEFMQKWITDWLDDSNHRFITLSQAAQLPICDDISFPATVTWADTERDLSAWLGNSMQHEALRHLYALEDDILRTSDHDLIADWRALQTSDHAYYMCTKWWNDGDVHAYFSPYDSPYDAFIYFMNVIRDLRLRVMQKQSGVS